MQRPKIIIVGAGMAGISAANRLCQAGFTDLLILEAANRIGGRIHTVSFGDGKYPVELGANWIHGPTLANSTFRVADAIGLLTPYRLNNRMSARFMREDGTEIDRYIVKEAIHIHSHVHEEVSKHILHERVSRGKMLTIAPLIYEWLENELSKLKRDDLYKQDLRRAFYVILNHTRFHEGDELEKITLEKMSDHDIPPGGDVHIPGGYVQILNHLMKVVPEGALKLNTEVVRINWSKEKGSKVEVIVEDGSRFKADHVIVTCSLGYLKKHHETLFDPSLPNGKVDAIKSIALGRVNKIFLEFDQAILAPSYKNVAFAWDDMNTKGEGVGNEIKWYKRIFGFELVFTKNNTLLGWISGDGAEYMEKLSNDAIGRTCAQLLRKFLNKKDIPDPKNVLVSRWCSNPYILGTYNYHTTKMFPGEQTTLAEPLMTLSGKPLVMFAGEAVANGCTQGARDTGLREADRLIKLYSNENLNSKL